jgi:hypothetical protein
MGAPIGNRNAAGPHSYRSSGAKKYLRRKMGSYRNALRYYQQTTPMKERALVYKQGGRGTWGTDSHAPHALKMKMKFT